MEYIFIIFSTQFEVTLTLSSILIPPAYMTCQVLVRSQQSNWEPSQCRMQLIYVNWISD